MPELPDVEIYRQTAEKANQKKIRRVTAHDKQFDRIDEKEIVNQFKNKKITRATRRGKHLFLFSKKDSAMVMHFGMTGDLKYVHDKEDLPEYTKLELQFENDDKLAYISKRKLGFVAFTDNPEKFIEENDIGADALDLSKSEFINKIKSKKSMLKPALMDQSVTSGIGNVYSDEILYQCRLHPKTKTTDLTDEDWGKLHKSMKSVMKTAIDKNALPSELPKSYLTRHRKEGEKCPKCKGEIKKIINFWLIQIFHFTLHFKVLFKMENKHIAEIQEIRKMMESSSRFLSLSGLSGVFAGIIALLGAAAAFFYLDYDKRYFDAYEFFAQSKSMKYRDIALFLIIDGAFMIVGALASAIYFTSIKAKRKGLPLWDNIAKRMLINLAIPLVTGGIFVLMLIYHRLIYLIAPATLVFYGLALLNGSKYTYDDLRMLALSEIILGLIAMFFIGYGLIFWALGFGVLHIIYGVVMYHKYER